jgi:hypothetical protein
MKKFIIIFMKYYLSKSLINYYTIYNAAVNFKNLKWLIFRNPHSVFIIKTIFGYKNHYFCLYLNISGIIILKIN